MSPENHMKIFITGSNGFIGSHVVKKALSSGHEIVGLRRSNHLAKIDLPRQPTWVEGTLETDMRRSLKGCEAIIHLSAYGVNANFDSRQEAFRWNVSASLDFWGQAKQVGIKSKASNDQLKIFGKDTIEASNKRILVKNLGDHRICMSSFILAVLTGAKTNIKNFETVNTSSPSFLKIMKNLGANFEIQK